MPTYKVDFAGTGSLTLTIEADSEDEARERAETAAAASLCIQCSGYTTSNYDPASTDPPYALDLDDPTEITNVEEA